MKDESEEGLSEIVDLLADIVDTILCGIRGRMREQPSSVSYEFDYSDGRHWIIFTVEVDNRANGVGRVIGTRHRNEQALRTLLSSMIPRERVLLYIVPLGGDRRSGGSKHSNVVNITPIK